MSALVIAVLAPVVIAAVGVSIDSGNLAVEKSNVQKAADSAAMAIGQDCATATRTGATTAQRNRCSLAGGTATAQLMINGNAPGATAVVSSALAPSAGSTTITISKTVTMPFGGSVGVSSRVASASASVNWSQVATAATTFPLGMSICDHQAWKDSPSTTPKLYRYDFYQSGRSDDGDNTAVKCGTKYSLKGGLWLIDGSAWIPNSGCKISTSIGITGWIAASNVFFPTSCAERARALEAGKTYMLPVYDTPAASKYTNRFLPTIRGYAPFVITGWRIGGWFGIFGVESGGSVSSSCTIFNLCRGVQGYFSGSVVPVDEVDSYGINPDGDFGSIRVKLTS